METYTICEAKYFVTIPVENSQASEVRKVIFRISQPEPYDLPRLQGIKMHVCIVNIEGLEAEKRLYGVSSLQALCLAIQHISIKLREFKASRFAFYSDAGLTCPFDMLSTHFLEDFLDKS
ncbi:DUF6968 family protein [Vibrio sagamiensis]|uniref:DUF6968 domain-containing protein n=1 Tax=Vibrio sagamiensis NBRC 104589 TaxID=1219064 RepID=A0A511QLU1_9VIBR|nr:hypothetical protein [Vibrio sagamiensis]PNQ53904.1 hypothetical protein C1141_18745 [Vibrio agarivorans]GEM77482.1 hypothetical protein VSA01S_35940 [Vibrio sagamiensis NBRC 104589]